MKYKDEQIDEMLSCYYRVEVKSYVVKKYGISADTLNKYLKNPNYSEKLVNKRIANRNKLVKYREILEFYNQHGKEKTIQNYKLKAENFDERLQDMKYAVFYNRLNYKEIIRQLENCLDGLEKVYKVKPDRLTLNQIIEANRYLMVSEAEIKTKYNLE
ncbi:hypothetical protein HCY52_08345 [Acinetobacter radioresistens]|uniref:hypothetical protein n=1 Tax=Acinetobacter radioresistens TaxID=40216 RepID=UPI0020063DD8|nr:hypothetical protein [Acinetobacter radioresistens]MCK4083825.1 hypothetical protein [Acinetobacter radioresistens]